MSLKPKYLIYQNSKSGKYYIKERYTFLFWSWYMMVSGEEWSEGEVLYFSSLKQAQNYIKDVLEYEKNPYYKDKLVDKIWGEK